MPLRSLPLVAAIAALGAALIPGAAHAAAPVRGAVYRAHSTLRQAPVPGQATPAAIARPAAASPSGYIPCDVWNAYGANGASLATGAGVTIAVIDAYDNPTVAGDLAAFDSAFGLPNPPLSKVTPFGTPNYNAGWATEIALDVEWAHAMAPGARIVLVEAIDNTVQDPYPGGLVQAVDYAVQVLNADIVSMSFSVSGVPAGDISFFDRHFPATNTAGRPVSYVAAAGDEGFGSSWPAQSANVVGVGGTRLTPGAFGYTTQPSSHLNCAGAGAGGTNTTNETVWGGTCGTGSPPCQGTGGGFVSGYPKPSWQTGGPAWRGMPDVAALADPASGVAVFVNGSWSSFMFGGTSLATPIWAGVIARGNELRQLYGGTALSRPSWVYSLSAGAFNDVISGSSPASPTQSCSPQCDAATGYDLVTGRGSPHVSALLSELGGPAPSGNAYAPLTQPVRILDTRPPTQVGPRSTPLDQNDYSVPITGNPLLAGQLPPGASTVAVNVTATDATKPTFLTLYPDDGSPLPNASNLNVFPSQQVANLVVVKLGPSGAIKVHNDQGLANVILDVQGTMASGAGGRFVTLPAPVRLLDTRPAYSRDNYHRTPLAPGETMTVPVTGNSQLPPGVTITSPSAAVLNVTTVDPVAPGYLAVFPSAGRCAPGPGCFHSSNVNFAADPALPNRVISRVDDGNVYIFNGGSGNVDVVVDISGYFTTTGSLYTATAPYRLLDTRDSGAPVPAGGTITLDSPIPGAKALVANVTVTDSTGDSYLELFPGPARPNASDLNFRFQWVRPNLCVVAVGSDGKIRIYSSQASVHVIVDLAGWYS